MYCRRRSLAHGALGTHPKEYLSLEADVYKALLPKLDGMVEKTGAKSFVTRPLVSNDEWEDVQSVAEIHVTGA